MTLLRLDAAAGAFAACPACHGSGVSGQHPYTGEATECECRAILAALRALPAFEPDVEAALAVMCKWLFGVVVDDLSGDTKRWYEQNLRAIISAALGPGEL